MEIKRVLKYFTIFEWEKEQDYLRKMHQSGWKLVKISGLCLYRFAKCPPEDVIYQLDYNREGRAHKAEYLQLFRDCGWEYLQDYVGYSYFRKPVSEMKGDEEEIFCDDDSRLEMLSRVFRGRMIPLLIIFFLVIIPQLFMQAAGVGSTERSILILFLILFILYVAMFISFVVPFVRYYKSVHKK